MALKVKFSQDILDYTNERECKSTFPLYATISGLEYGRSYKIQYNIENVKYFDTIPENLNNFSFSTQSKTIIATKNTETITTNVNLVCIRSAIIRVKIEDLSTYQKVYDYILVKCPLCNDSSNSPFSVELLLDNIGTVTGQNVDVLDCTISAPISAVGKNLTVGKRYKCEFLTLPVLRSEVDFTQSSSIIFAGEVEQNFNTVILINKNESFFYLYAKVTDMSTGIASYSQKYFCQCQKISGDCQSLPTGVNLEIDENPFDRAGMEPSAVQNLLFLDSVTNDPVFINTVDISITNVKYNNISYPDSTIDINGIDGNKILLSIKPGLDIGNGSYVTCWLSINNPDYLVTGQTVLFNTQSATTIYKLVNVSNLPNSITKSTKTVYSSPNGLSQTVTLVCEPSEVKEESCTITIPPNTILTDALGQRLEGNITFTAYHFDNDDVSSLSSFPGGMIIADSYNLNGSANDPGIFYSYGFIAIEATDSSGRKARNISGNTMNITADINPYSLSPTTDDSFINSGDTIRVWSLNSDTGTWQEEAQPVLVNNTITFNTNHMSYWNFDAKIDDVCEKLILDFPSEMVLRYKSIIDSSGLYVDQVNEVLGGHNITGARRRALILPPQKTDPGETKLNVLFYPKRFNNNINYAKFVFYLTAEDFSKGINPIGQISYSNSSVGRTVLCDCSSNDSSCSSTVMFTPTPSPTSTKAPTPTPSITATYTPTPTVTVTCSETAAPTPTPTITPSISPSNNPTNTPTPSITASHTPTHTPTPSYTSAPGGVSIEN